MRCSELPCVKESGFTCPVAVFCSRFARGEAEGDCAHGKGSVWRRPAGHAEKMDAGGKEAAWKRHSRCKERAPEISRDWRARRGEDSAVFEVGTGGGRAVRV